MNILKMLVVLAVVGLAGCAQLDHGVAIASDQMCSVNGAAGRTAFRVTQDATFRAQDKALCSRCPGEPALSCTGDPKALPVTP